MIKTFSRKAIKEASTSLNLKDSVASVLRLAQGVSGGLSALCGLENQAAHHLKLVDVIVSDLEKLAEPNLDASEIPYTDAQLYALELALSNSYDVIIRLQPASVTELGTLLKEIRTLLSISYERQHLLQSMKNLFNTVNTFQFFKMQYFPRLIQALALDARTLKQQMKLDEDGFKSLLSQKCKALESLLSENNESPELTAEIERTLSTFSHATTIMPVVDALDMEEVVLFDQLVRKEIVFEESKIEEESLHLTTQLLGEGSFGNVIAAILIEDETEIPVCVKSLSLEEELFKDEYDELTNEVAMWREINHKNVLTCFGLCLKNSYVHLVFERMKTTLEDLIHKRKGIPSSDQVSRIMKDISLGLSQLHALNIIHRNLKPSNIYFEENNFNSKAKLGDFGLGFYKYCYQTNGPSVYTPPEVLSANSFISGFNNSNGSNNASAENNIENPQNTEVVCSFLDWTKSGDIYCFALVAWEMCQNPKAKPYEGQEYNLHSFVGKEGNRPNLLTGIFEPWVQEIVKNCWDQLPEKRPTAQSLAETIITKLSNLSTAQNSKNSKSGANMKGKKPSRQNMNNNNNSMYKEQLLEVPEKLELTKGQSRRNNRNPMVKSIQVTQSSGNSNSSNNNKRRSVQVFDTRVVDMTDEDVLSQRKNDNMKSSKLAFKNANNESGAPIMKSVSFNRNSVMRQENIQSARKSLNLDMIKKMDFKNLKKEDIDKKLPPTPSRQKIYNEDETKESDEDFIPGTVAEAIKLCTKPNKINSRIRNLPEEIMDSDRLDLDTTFFYFWLKKVNDLDCEAIGHILIKNNSFLRLSLEFNKITNEGTDNLSKGIGSHRKLLQVYLGNNKGINNVEKLMNELKHNQTLEVLSFTNCNLGDLAAYHIGEFLKTNNTLLQLDVSQNKIGNEGLRRIAEGLKENTGLQSLIVSDNSGPKGLKILKAVAKSKGLKLNKYVIEA